MLYNPKWENVFIIQKKSATIVALVRNLLFKMKRISIHEQERNWFTKLIDYFFPIYSFSCGHKLRRIQRMACIYGRGSQQYCPKCDLLVPDCNIVIVKPK